MLLSGKLNMYNLLYSLYYNIMELKIIQPLYLFTLREIKALQEIEPSPYVVKLHEIFPHGTGIVIKLIT